MFVKGCQRQKNWINLINQRLLHLSGEWQCWDCTCKSGMCEHRNSWASLPNEGKLKWGSISGQNNKQMAILNNLNLIWIQVRYETKTNEFHSCAWVSRAHFINTTMPLSFWLSEMSWPDSPKGREQVTPGSLSAWSGCQMAFESSKFYSKLNPLLFFYQTFLLSFHFSLSFCHLFEESLV